MRKSTIIILSICMFFSVLGIMSEFNIIDTTPLTQTESNASGANQTDTNDSNYTNQSSSKFESSTDTDTEVTLCNHSWNDATCGTPKTCSLCGATEGSTTGIHSFSAGVCSVCDLTKPNLAEIQKVLTDIERYINYMEIDAEMLTNEIELYRISGDVKYFVEAQEKATEIHSHYVKIYEQCYPYKDLELIYMWCDLDPIILSPNKLASAESYATKTSSIITAYRTILDVYF